MTGMLRFLGYLFSRTERFRRLRPLWGVLRVALYLTVVFAVVGAFAARSALGDMEEQALVIGRQLAGLEDLTDRGYRVRLNGQAIHVSSTITDSSVVDVLDRFEAACADGTLLSEAEFAAVSDADWQTALPDLDPNTRAWLGVLRNRTEVEGMVACLAKGPEHAGQSLVARLTEATTSWDLAAVGYLRYGYARRTASGRTQVITAWTDESFRLDALAPMDGREPPGTDIPGMPRPAGAVRVLSAEVDGVVHGLRIYDAPGKATEVLAAHASDMVSAGWSAIPLRERHDGLARVFSKHGIEVVVTAAEADGRTAFTVLSSIAVRD